MGGERGERLILTNILKYEIDQLKPKQTASFAKSTDTGAKQTITGAKPNSHTLNCR